MNPCITYIYVMFFRLSPVTNACSSGDAASAPGNRINLQQMLLEQLGLRTPSQSQEGCTVSGVLNINKVAGMFEFTFNIFHFEGVVSTFF